MFTRLRNWNRERKEWSKAHDEAWKGMTEIQENNLTKFQNECLTQLKSSLSENSLALSEIKIEKVKGIEENEGYDEKCIICLLPKSGHKIYIYEDGVQIEEELNYEDWDFKTPQEMIAKFVASAINLEIKEEKKI